MERLERMRALAQAGGGAERIAAQRAKGKLGARERIALLTDPGTFVEYEPYLAGRDGGAPGDGVVAGTALVEGRQVWISSQDFTVLGGSLGEAQAEKIARAQRRALQTGCPFIQVNDSGGARIQEGVYSLDGYGKIFANNVHASGVIPQVSLILGPCAGGAAYSPAITDFVYMVDGVSQMYITGPDVIKAVTGEDVGHAELGGAAAHAAKSGNAHFRLPDEASCFAHVRRLLSYLPSNNTQRPPVLEGAKAPASVARTEEILSGPPTKAYDMREVIAELFDAGSFLEVHEGWAQSIVVGFARLEGRPVGVIASQPRFLSGTLDINSSDKGARFVRFCDAFNVPIVSLADVPGYMPGTAQEWNGIIRHGAKLLYAVAEATVPKVALIVRKAYGGAYIAMASRTLGYDRVLALHTAEVAVMGAEGAANIIHRREIAASADPAATRAQKIAEYREGSMNPFVSAAGGDGGRRGRPRRGQGSPRQDPRLAGLQARGAAGQEAREHTVVTRTLFAIAAIASVAAALAFALRRRRGLSAEADGHEPSPVDPWLVASRDDAWASVELPQNEAHAMRFPLEETQPWNS